MAEGKDQIEDLSEIGPNDLMIYMETGKDFSPSPRLREALEELSKAMSEEEVAEVSGFDYEPTMAVGSTGGDAAGFKIGCVRIGCVGKGTGSCGESKIVVRCPKNSGDITIERSFDF